MSNKVVSLTELIETRFRKRKEIEYYQETLMRLQEKIAELDKEVDITTLIIDMIENERVLTVTEKRDKILLLDEKKEELYD
tara:strand:+ start:862 stop:1104 length:243 start_codon:yes stop_codon:yes gene_type:complete